LCGVCQTCCRLPRTGSAALPRPLCPGRDAPAATSSDPKWAQATVGRTATLRWQPSALPNAATAAGSAVGENAAAELLAAPLYFAVLAGDHDGWRGAQFVVSAVPPKVHASSTVFLGALAPPFATFPPDKRKKMAVPVVFLKEKNTQKQK
jgi:hypothetical protein